MGNGTDDFSGPALKSETNDQAVGQMHDFGSTTMKDGKVCLNNEITSQCGSLGGSSLGLLQQPDIFVPGGLKQDAMKSPNMAPSGGDPATAGGLDKLDVK